MSRKTWCMIMDFKIPYQVVIITLSYSVPIKAPVGFHDICIQHTECQTKQCKNLFLSLLLRTSSLLLIRTPELFTPILPLLSLLSRRLLNFGRNTNTHFSVVRLKHTVRTTPGKRWQGDGYLEFLEIGFGIIDQGEASGLSASELRAESKCLDGFFGDFVHASETGTDIVFRKVGFGGVQDIDDL